MRRDLMFVDATRQPLLGLKSVVIIAGLSVAAWVFMVLAVQWLLHASNLHG